LLSATQDPKKASPDPPQQGLYWPPPRRLSPGERAAGEAICAVVNAGVDVDLDDAAHAVFRGTLTKSDDPRFPVASVTPRQIRDAVAHVEREARLLRQERLLTAWRERDRSPCPVGSSNRAHARGRESRATRAGLAGAPARRVTGQATTTLTPSRVGPGNQH